MKSESDSRDDVTRATELVRLFSSPEAFGEFRSIAPDQVPEPARTLLDHRSHMTVAMERFHDCDVRLRVVAEAADSDVASRADSQDNGASHGCYAREILLETPSGTVVQHGIVRIDLTHLDDSTARLIREGQRPLGRILIEAGMLRDVHTVKLLEVAAGQHLRERLRLADPSAKLYGRVAAIQLDGRPAVELLEIVVPAV
jgi:chorismate-pyruvate lyase